ncbi:MAG: 30S ribosomal protein S20 [Bacteroidetes bacterium]|jgi:small subunit ribosomal protein S20|nr:30S ribosomal protein S20 [Bacteroidota bacterium]
MPQHKSAIKRVRQNKKRQQHNKGRRTKMKTLVRDVFETSDKEEAREKLKKAVSLIDRLTTKGILHKNTAARQKSKLTTYVNNL